MRPVRRSPLAVLAATVVLAGLGCGPTSQEGGCAILIASGAIVLTSHLLLWPLFRLWRRRYADLRFPWRPALVFAGVCAAVGFPAAALWFDEAVELTVIAYWAAGTSYLALLLVTWRVWFQLRRADAFARALAVPAFVMFAPAVVLAACPPSEELELVFWLWLFPGYAGVVPGVLYVLALFEAIVWGRPTRPDGQASA